VTISKNMVAKQSIKLQTTAVATFLQVLLASN